MSLQRRVLAGAVGIALLAAACGGGTSSPAASGGPGDSTPPASQPAGASDAVTPSPTDSPAASDASFEPSYSAGAAPDLEAMIPDSAGGTTYAKVSFDGASLGVAGLGVDSGELDPILKAIHDLENEADPGRRDLIERLLRTEREQLARVLRDKARPR